MQMVTCRRTTRTTRTTWNWIAHSWTCKLKLDRKQTTWYDANADRMTRRHDILQIDQILHNKTLNIAQNKKIARTTHPTFVTSTRNRRNAPDAPTASAPCATQNVTQQIPTSSRTKRTCPPFVSTLLRFWSDDFFAPLSQTGKLNQIPSQLCTSAGTLSKLELVSAMFFFLCSNWFA